MINQKLKQNQSGFSLVSTMVSIAIMAITMTAFAQMMNNTEKSISAMKRKSEFDDLKLGMRQVIQSPSLCPSAFVGADGKSKLLLNFYSMPVSVPAMDSGGGGLLFDLRAGTERKSSGLSVTSLKITKATFDGNYKLNNETVYRYSLDVSVAAEQPELSYGAKKFSAEVVATAFYLRATGEVVACGADVVAQKIVPEVEHDEDDGRRS